MQQTVVTRIDDITGQPYETGETITFAVQGNVYEIDLNALNARNFRRSLAKYMDNARRVKATHTRTHTEPKHDRETLARVREWARENGHQVADRGRVPIAVFEAYERANG